MQSRMSTNALETQSAAADARDATSHSASVNARCQWEVPYIYYFLKDFQQVLGFKDILPAIEVFEERIEQNDEELFAFAAKTLLSGFGSRKPRSSSHWEESLKRVLKRHRSPYWEFSPLEHEWEYKRRLAKSRERSETRNRTASRHFGARRKKRRHDATKPRGGAHAEQNLLQRTALETQHAASVAASQSTNISEEDRVSEMKKQKSIEDELAKLDQEAGEAAELDDDMDDDEDGESDDDSDIDDATRENHDQNDEDSGKRSRKRKSVDTAPQINGIESTTKKQKTGASIAAAAGHNVVNSSASSADPMDVDSTSEKKFSCLAVMTKIRILACLVHWSHTTNKVLATVIARSSEEFPRRPVGLDKWGNSYWYFDDYRLYKECPTVFNGPMEIREPPVELEWSIVAQNKDEWTNFMRSIKGARNVEEKALYAILDKDAFPWIDERLAERESLEQKRLAEEVEKKLRPVEPEETPTRRRAPREPKPQPPPAPVVPEKEKAHVEPKTDSSFSVRAEADVLDTLASLAQASSVFEIRDKQKLGPPKSVEPLKRKVGRPPKSSRPVEVVPVDKFRKVEEEPPIELSPSGRPMRSRQRTAKFADDYIEGDFAQVLYDGDERHEDGRARRGRPSGRRGGAHAASRPAARTPPPSDANRMVNPLSASVGAADTLHEMKQLYASPQMMGYAATPAEYQLLMQQMAMYQQYPGIVGMQYSPQQMAAIAQMYGGGYMAAYPQAMMSPYYIPAMSPEQQAALMQRQNLISSTDIAAVQLAQFQYPGQIPTSQSPQPMPVAYATMNVQPVAAAPLSVAQELPPSAVPLQPSSTSIDQTTPAPAPDTAPQAIAAVDTDTANLEPQTVAESSVLPVAVSNAATSEPNDAVAAEVQASDSVPSAVDTAPAEAAVAEPPKDQTQDH